MERIGIVGLGLMGGSAGMALRRQVPEATVIGVARRAETARRAVELGATDEAGTDLAALQDADLVLLAVPLASTPEVLAEVAGHLREGARVTDVGSVKEWVAYFAEKELNPARNPFVGGHPMAGKEVTGVEHADPDLFRGRPWVFAPRLPEQLDPFGDLVEAVRGIGAKPIVMPPQQHDRYVALVSHLPFLLSAAYLCAIGDMPEWSDASALASSGFRDISRLGAGDPEMYAAIASSNREEVLRTWPALHKALDEFEAAIVRGDGELLMDLLRSARTMRNDWAAENPDIASPAP